jgi:hypothetical protein
MECDCENELHELDLKRRERRRLREGVGDKIRHAIELCADYCANDEELGAYGHDLLGRAKTGHIRSIRELLYVVDHWQPSEWSFNDAEAVETALIAVEYLEYGLLRINAAAVQN